MEETLKRVLKQLKLNESTVSTILGALVVIVVGVLLFNFFSKSQKGEVGEEAVVTEEVAKGEEGITPEGLPTTHRVEEGEHLWKIAEEHYGSGYNWVDIAEENNLRNPNLLAAGGELTIPAVAAKKITIEPAVAGVAEVAEAGEAIESDRYVVQEGDSLWKIAVRAYGDGYKWPEIAEENNLRNPNIIVPDQELKLPR
jgi:nucleoid-associated protein YgaU